MKQKVSARLVLQDGSVFDGYSFGSSTSASGEVVFNTGMVGYPETLTDPSYSGQILVLTYPLIGNYGVPRFTKEKLERYFESSKMRVKGLIISDYSSEYSHWNAKNSLSEWLRKEGIPGIFGIDTRALTKKLRYKGTMLGKIVIEGDVELYDPNTDNQLEKISAKKLETYGNGKIRIVVVDCGVKYNIIRSFLNRGVKVIRVPYNYDFNKLSFDGLFLSNGPGDPKMAKETIRNLKVALQGETPIFGICMGNQLLNLAAGGDTYKLKYGHRSQNQPCIEIGTKRCYITSQNHGYAVNSKKLPTGWDEWFINANDGTNEGIIHKRKPFFSVQFHPEAAPGPTDTAFLFDRFLQRVRNG